MGHVWITGEALIDFVPITVPQGTAYLPCEGGSTYNVAKATARQGSDVSFLGPISQDLFGDMLRDDLAREGVELRYAPRIDAPTPLAFVKYEGSDARYAFYDRASTMVEAPYGETLSDLRPGDILHAGSISLIPDPGADRLERLMLAHRDRAILSLDPNARPGMIADMDKWRNRISRLADAATILRLSDEDLSAWQPGRDPRDFIDTQLASGTALVVLTYGKHGAEAATPAGRARVPARTDGLVDTVGAGDTVMGTVLAAVDGHGLTNPDQIAALGDTALEDLLTRAMRAAWLNCHSAGCNPPTRRAIDSDASLEPSE
ncbi:carbohydrate kinase family protein [Tropicimonas marinistellae]|uniref:carbohydrate kinase family protein n=1 Tax=Tropicimonas marinistellae TaxID=1739787 RepID=UPI00082ED048|nr:carbohydrate kinase [Tropicimonas marinistellae]